MSFVCWLDGYDPAQRARLGGKNASLGEMLAAGLPVPPGFAVTVDAYHTVRGHPEVRQAVVGLLGEVDLADPAALEELSAAIRRRIEQVPLDDAVAAAVASAYTELCERCQLDAVPVAVRSSATSEDLPDASFAGEHDTYLWVRGRRRGAAPTSPAAGRACSRPGRSPTGASAATTTTWSPCRSGSRRWSAPRPRGWPSPSTPATATAPRSRSRPPGGSARASCPARSPRTASWSTRCCGEIVQRTISDKAVEYRLGDGDRVERVAGRRGPPDRPQPHRRPGQGGGPAGPAGRAALPAAPRTWSGPLTPTCPDDQAVTLLQARPETVWSRKAATPVAAAADPMASIVATLLSPLHTRGTLGHARAVTRASTERTGPWRTGSPAPSRSRPPRGPRGGRSCTPTRCRSRPTGASTRTRCSGSRTGSTGRRS